MDAMGWEYSRDGRYMRAYWVLIGNVKERKKPLRRPRCR
jgi:hypothetical protein